jgi:hypothetical protein
MAEPVLTHANFYRFSCTEGSYTQDPSPALNDSTYLVSAPEIR